MGSTSPCTMSVRPTSLTKGETAVYFTHWKHDAAVLHYMMEPFTSFQFWTQCLYFPFDRPVCPGPPINTSFVLNSKQSFNVWGHLIWVKPSKRGWFLCKTWKTWCSEVLFGTENEFTKRTQWQKHESDNMWRRKRGQCPRLGLMFPLVQQTGTKDGFTLKCKLNVYLPDFSFVLKQERCRREL